VSQPSEPAAEFGVPFAVRTAVSMTGLVVGANVAGGAVVAFIMLSLNTAAPHGERRVLVVVSAIYGVGALAVGTVIGILLHLRTLRWLARGSQPTREEAHRALRTPIALALLTGGFWIFGALVIGSLVAALGGSLEQVFELGSGLVLAGLSTAGVTYLLVGRFNRPVARLALAHYPPGESMVLSVRSRLLLNWLLTTGVPVLGIILVLASPRGRTHVQAAGIALAVVALGVGILAAALASRAIGVPLRNLLDVLHRVGAGSLDTDVIVDDPGEIGMLQNGVNEMVAGLRERDRINDLFGRHVGPAVAQEALRHGVTLSGETRDVVALFVDITGSTALTHTTDPREFVAMLNRFFGVVVDQVEAAGGLVNKFEGDAALCVFGAPVELDDPATAALCSARQICVAVQKAGEVEIGIGVAAGPVVAGQIGAPTRLEYTVIGDAVNEAARLTELAKQRPGRVLASADVVAAASPEERTHWVPAGVATLRGRDEPTRTYVLAPEP
jgi:adenylate cyclase